MMNGEIKEDKTMPGIRDDPSGDKLDKRVVKIHYCPMCGRRLQ